MAAGCGAAIGIGGAYLPGVAQGAGFALIEQSASGMGNAFAGGAAVAEDATTVFFNPAGMTRIEGRQAVLGLHWISPKADFTDTGSQAGDGSPLTGSGDDGGEEAVVGNAYLVTDLDERWKFGLGLNAPFGLSTKYDADWVGRYHAIESELRTVNLNPSFAVRMSDALSLGFGVNAQYVDVKLTSAVDFGTLIGAPQAADGQATIKGTNWAYGWNLGMLYNIDPQTRLGMAYRSRVRQKVDGTADFSYPNPTVAGAAAAGLFGGAFVDTDASADVTLPASASVSLFHRYDDRLAVMGDLTWTGWGVFDELRVEYANPNQPDTVTTENWKDSWRLALGLDYTLDPRLTLRGGIAYDQSPIPDDQHRTPRIPGNGRRWLALGLGYRIGKTTALDLGYAHLFVSDTGIDNTLETAYPALNHTLKGDYESSVDILSAQFKVDF